MKCWAEWSSSWNQDSWEKYQQPQICTWHHPHGRKQRGTKDLDEGERGKWKSLLKTHIQKKIMASNPITSCQIDGEQMETVRDSIFLGSKITVDGEFSHQKALAPLNKCYGKSRHCIKKQRYYFIDKGPSSQSCGFPNSHTWMWQLGYKECWVLKKKKKWYFQSVGLEKILEIPLDSKEIKVVNPKENQLWIPIGRTDAEAESPIIWPPYAKNQFIGKDPDVGTSDMQMTPPLWQKVK